MLLKLHHDNLINLGFKEDEVKEISKKFVTVMGETYFLTDKTNKLDKDNKLQTILLFLQTKFNYNFDPKTDKAEIQGVLAYIASNVWDTIDIRRNLLLKSNKVELDYETKTVIEWISSTHKEINAGDIPADIKKEYIDDYLRFFPDFENLLKFIVSSNISANKKFSFGLILGESNKGKSVLMDALAMANITKVVMGSFPFKLDASPYTPEAIVKPMALFIDEFTQFYDAYKDLTDTVSMAVKYGTAKTVSIGVKLFATTKLPSDLAGGGVDEQIYNRLAIFKIDGKDYSLGDLPAIKKYGEAYFKPIIAEYASQKVTEFIEDFRKLGNFKGANRAGKIIQDMKTVFGLKSHHEAWGESVDMGQSAREKILEGLEILIEREDSRVEKGNRGEVYLKAPLKTIADALRLACTDGEWRKLRTVIISLTALKNETGISVKRTTIKKGGKKVNANQVVGLDVVVDSGDGGDNGLGNSELDRQADEVATLLSNRS